MAGKACCSSLAFILPLLAGVGNKYVKINYKKERYDY